MEKRVSLTRDTSYHGSSFGKYGKHGDSYRYDQDPAYVTCQHCNTQITSEVTLHSGLLSWSIVGFLCLSGCWLGCCFVPLCLKFTKDATHRCPACKEIVGIYRNC